VKVDAVVLAGGDGEVIDLTVRIKGLVPIANRPMIAWVVEALRAAETIGEIIVVVPTDRDLGSWTDSVDHIVVSDGSFMDNAIAGFSALENGRSVLAATGDLPALTPEGVDDFVSQSLASGAEFTYPLVSAADMEEQFPGSQRTYVKVAGGKVTGGKVTGGKVTGGKVTGGKVTGGKVTGGKVTGGNMMLLSPELVRRHRELGQRLFDARKSPVRMAQVLGVPFIVKYVLGTLRVEDVERKMELLLNAKCAAISTHFAAIGADVDKPIDVVVAERVLYRRSSGRNSPESAE
jgi:GTP:adenosylcobinamide-phosphate guanylyltransferase